MGRLFLFAEPNEDCVTPKASLYTHTHTHTHTEPLAVLLLPLLLVMFFFPPCKRNHYYCSVLISRLFIFPALISENRKRRFCRMSQTKQNRKDVTQRFWKPDFNLPRLQSPLRTGNGRPLRAHIDDLKPTTLSRLLSQRTKITRGL